MDLFTLESESMCLMDFSTLERVRELETLNGLALTSGS